MTPSIVVPTFKNSFNYSCLYQCSSSSLCIILDYEKIRKMSLFLFSITGNETSLRTNDNLIYWELFRTLRQPMGFIDSVPYFKGLSIFSLGRRWIKTQKFNSIGSLTLEKFCRLNQDIDHAWYFRIHLICRKLAWVGCPPKNPGGMKILPMFFFSSISSHQKKQQARLWQATIRGRGCSKWKIL